MIHPTLNQMYLWSWFSFSSLFNSTQRQMKQIIISMNKILPADFIPIKVQNWTGLSLLLLHTQWKQTSQQQKHSKIWFSTVEIMVGFLKIYKAIS